MKILLIHNFYGSNSPSGENIVFDLESNLLRSLGHEVFEFVRYSDEIRGLGTWGLIKGAISVPWNPWTTSNIRKLVQLIKPDIAHVHNSFPLISPSIFYGLGRVTAKVMTLHNYRIFCPSAIPMRTGSICTECIDRKSTLPSIRYGCYRDSRLATLPIAASVTLHRLLGTWTKHVDAFITLSEFQRATMIQAGLPEDLVHVKPNFFPGNPDVYKWEDRSNCVVYAGRLSQEKGILTLIEAWRKWGSNAPLLKIIGNGPLYEKIYNLLSNSPSTNILLMGHLSTQITQLEIAQSKMLILPSEWYEGFPMVIREAFASATPIAASNIGALSTIISHLKNGLLFDAFNSDSLLKVVKEAWFDIKLLKSLSDASHNEFIKSYNESSNYSKLIDIYTHAINVKNNRMKKFI